MQEEVEIIVNKSTGKRLDSFLAERFRSYSRSYFQRLIKEEKVLVDGRPVKPSHKIEKGESIRVEFVSVPSKLEPEELPLDVLYEDDWLIVLNKPADTVVHPTSAHQRGTLINALIYHCQKLSALGHPTRPGIVHRLDKDTTGVLVVAKDQVAHIHLARQFHDRTAEKEYICVVEGEMKFDSDIVSIPLGRHHKHKEMVTVRADDGKESVSIYEVIERYEGFTLVGVQPHTGRTHQIRAQMAWLGHPVVCDKLYGRRKILRLSDLSSDAGDTVLMDRQALHAHRLRVLHPATGEKMEFVAPLPDDIQSVIDALRAWRRKR